MFDYIRMAAVTLIVCALPALSQTSSRSLAETTSSLQLDLSGDACLSYAMGRSQAELTHYVEGTEAFFLGCEMSLSSSDSDGKSSRQTNFKVHLGKLDPKRIEISPGVDPPPFWLVFGEPPRRTIRLTTLNDEKVIAARAESIGTDAQGSNEFQTSEIRIRVRNAEAAETMASAFAHAIELCRP